MSDSKDDIDQQLNQAWWNERAAFHVQTPLYQKHIQRLKAGGLALLPLERRELGVINGLTVMHLQCHIGTDTLSLARLGANVLGIDFSKAAIEVARELSKELGIDARFKVHEIKEIAQHYPAYFDLVFTSHGVIPWLPDLDLWAEQIARCLRPEGRLYLSDSHPLVWSLSDKGLQNGALQLTYPYLRQPEAASYHSPGSYADSDRHTKENETREWSWGLGDILRALVGAGLSILWLNENPEGFYPAIPELIEGEDGHYRLPDPLHGRYPLSFSLMAQK